MHHAASQPPPALPVQGAALHPRAGPGRQLDNQLSGVVAGQRLGGTAEERGLVAGVERVPRLVVHQHHVVGQRKDDPAGVPAGPQVLPQQLELPGAAVVEQALRDLAGSALGERDQQPAGVTAPAGQAHRADDQAGDGVPDRHRGAGQVDKLSRVVLVPEHVRRPAALQRRADPVGAGELLGVAEARRQLNAVQVLLKVVVGGQPGQRQPMRIGEDDADRLALKTLAQVLQHRQGGAGQRGIQVGIADIGKVNAIGRDMPLPGAPPRRQDRLTHLARLDGLRCQEPFPGPGQLAVISHLRPQTCSARHACPPSASAAITGPAGTLAGGAPSSSNRARARASAASRS
jgi:hypothetical protein